jgi:predicted AAA+ superfamily ATPase
MIERTMKSVFEDFFRNFRVLLLTGQRQVGKTTLLENLRNSYINASGRALYPNYTRIGS